MIPLSASEQKLSLYDADIYYREGTESLDVLTPAERARLLSQYTVVVFKPEAIAGRRVGAGLQFLVEAGFELGPAHRYRFSRLSIREVWRYQIIAAHSELIALVDELDTSSDSLLVVVRGPAYKGETAAAALARLKGPSDPRKRRPGQLRSAMGPPCGALTLAHCPDEPADLIRELAILCDPDARLALIHHALAWLPVPDIAEEVGALYRGVATHDLDYRQSWRRAMAASGAVAQRTAIGDVTLPARDASWVEVAPLVAGAAHWDRLVIAAHLVRTTKPGAAKLESQQGRS
jgi:nucleoside diphosphate kinase